MNAPQQLPLIPIGTAHGGGYVLGYYFDDLQPRRLIVSPKFEGEIPVTIWNKSEKMVNGALSFYAGLANTRAMAEAGSPLAEKLLGLRLGGFDDWHLMARVPALVALAHNDLLPEAERFERAWYWTSTQDASTGVFAWFQSFNYGSQFYLRKSTKLHGRAVRSETI